MPMIKLGAHVIYVRSMGKAIQVIAIATSDAEANSYMERHPDAALIAEIDGLLILANKWDMGVKICP